MEKLIIDLSNNFTTPEKGDLLVYDKGWKTTTHYQVFEQERKEINFYKKKVDELSNRVKELEGYIQKLAMALKEK